MRDAAKIAIAINTDGEFFFFERFEPAHPPAPRCRVFGSECIRTRQIDISDEMCKMAGSKTTGK